MERIDAIDEFRARTAPFLADWRSIEIRIVASAWRGKWVAEGLRAVLLHDEPSDVPTRTDLPRAHGLLVVHEVWPAARLGDVLSGIERGEVGVGAEPVFVGVADRERVLPFSSLRHGWDDRDHALATFGMDWMTISLSFSQDHVRTMEESRALDAMVRSAKPSWDGMGELKRDFLGVRRLTAARNEASVEVLAPVQVRIASAELEADRLRATVDVHPKLDASHLGGWVIARTRHGATHRIPVHEPWSVPVPPGTSRATAVVLYRGIDIDRRIAVLHGTAPQAAIYADLVKGGLVSLEDRLRRAKGVALERQVAWLFHLLGFLTGHYGRENDAPAVVALSPDGPFLVVECASEGRDLTPKISRLATWAAKLSETAEGRTAIPVLVGSFDRGEMNEADLNRAATGRVAVVSWGEIAQLLALAKSGAAVSETVAFVRGLIPSKT